MIRVQEALNVDTVAILLHDAGSNNSSRAPPGGSRRRSSADISISIRISPTRSGQRIPIFIADVDHADVMNPILREKGIESLLEDPLVVEGELVGVLHVGSLRPRNVGQDDLAVLRIGRRARGAGDRAREVVRGART